MNPAFMRPRKPASCGSRDPLWYRYRFTLSSAAVIMIAVLLPGSSFSGMPVDFIGIDKIIHFFMFFIFSMSYSMEYRNDRKRMPRILPLLALFFGFAFLTELSQLFADGRSFDPLDGLADFGGAVSARIIAGLFCRRTDRQAREAFTAERKRRNRKS